MADVFISYARADKARVAPLVKAIEAKGWSVWWDPDISPGQEFDDKIDVELQAARAVLVVWTPTSVASRWVRGEARDGAERGILVPVRFEQARLPIDVRAIHTTDLDGWHDDASNPAVQECLHALGDVITRARAAEPAVSGTAAATAPAKPKPNFSICVLPFVNMSGDSEQEYFSDGITEDIITDLSKVSALAVASSNTAFRYKGQHVDIEKVARELKVTHVLEGSVRKAGGRIRINAQLIDGSDDNHVWAERYDRDASDIFAIQDEISQAIVKALKLRLLPEEKKAIEQRRTSNADAYNLYLMARQTYVDSPMSDFPSAEAIVRICKRVTEIDPNYAEAWALLAAGHQQMNWLQGNEGNDAMDAVEHALRLNPKLAEAHAVRAQILRQRNDLVAAAVETDIALGLDPESYEVNRAAGYLYYQQQKFVEAARFYEKAAALLESDIVSAAMLASCYTAAGDVVQTRRAAELTLKRAEAVLTHDKNNAGATAYSVDALAILGEVERAKARMERALLVAPDNVNTRYNFACMLCVRLKDKAAALDMIEPIFATITASFLPYVKVDPDLELLHDDPRYKAMVAAAEARLVAANGSTAAAGE